GAPLGKDDRSAGDRRAVNRIRAIAPLRTLLLACAIVCAPPAPHPGQGRAGFAAQVAGLSEAGGYFDTDNLISNESSYLQVIPELQRKGVHGGAYIGVGPDQNFTYIAEVRPTIAFI